MNMEDGDIERSLKGALQMAFETDGKIVLPAKSLIEARIREISFTGDNSSFEVIFPIYWENGTPQIGFMEGEK